MVDLPEPDSPPDRKSLTLEDPKLMLLQARTYWRRLKDGTFGDELQIHVLHPQQRAFIGALVLTLAEPVGLEIDAGIRRTGIPRYRRPGEAYQLHIRAGKPPR